MNIHARWANANWLWPEGELYLLNCHAQFRHDFELPKAPESAPLFITADQMYRLYINGRYVCRGPARGYQDHWPYDQIEVAPYLVAGHNWIAVEAYNPGLGTFQYLHCSNAGMICAADWGETRIATTSKDWIMRRAPGNNPYVARLSRQLAFQEDFDAGVDDGAWITSARPPVWSTAGRIPWDGEVTFGTLPWVDVEPRGIPMLREELLIPACVSSVGIGRMAPDWRRCFNLAWHWSEKELPTVRDWRDGSAVRSVRTGDALEFVAEPVADTDFCAVTVELGRISFGTLTLELVGTGGGEVVDCYYHQSLKRGIPEHLLAEQNPGFIGMATRLRAAPGRCRREFFVLMGCRQVTLILRRITAPVTVRVAWRTAEYPFAMRGRFQCSDPVLNAIEALCRNTQQICAADAYMDTPWREQGQWWGDARIQARNTFYLDGDARLLARGIRSIAGQQAPRGMTYGVAPCCNGNCILADFALTWIITIYDYWFQTGSLELFDEFHDRIRKILDYFDSMEDAGIVRADPRFWLFEDWAELPKTGHPTFLNLWRLYALEHYVRLLRAAQHDAAPVEAKIARLRLRLTEALFDRSGGLFRSSLENTAPPSVHDQVLAVLLDMVPEYHRNMLDRRILPFLRDEAVAGAIPGAFWCSYLFEAARKLGHGRDVVRFIRIHWERMLASGGCWESLAWNEAGGESCCHAWSAHPCWHLPDIFWGIRQLAPAWRQVAIEPDFGLLTGSGLVILPLPPGDLRLEWKDKTVTVTVPEGMEVFCADRTFPPGSHTWNNREDREKNEDR